MSTNETRYCNQRECPVNLKQFAGSNIACCPLTGLSVKVNSHCEVEAYKISQYLESHAQTSAKCTPTLGMVEAAERLAHENIPGMAITTFCAALELRVAYESSREIRSEKP